MKLELTIKTRLANGLQTLLSYKYFENTIAGLERSESLNNIIEIRHQIKFKTLLNGYYGYYVLPYLYQTGLN